MIPEWNSFINADCMEYLKEFPDNYFDLAIVDPPYGDAMQCDVGGGTTGSENDSAVILPRRRQMGSIQKFGGSRPTHYTNGRRKKLKTYEDWRHLGSEIRKKIVTWDVAQEKEYFEQLFRISRNQIIWGGNYFELPPTRCFVIWEKTNIPENFSMAMCEYAWTSFQSNAKIWKHTSIRDNTSGKFHPTEKPIALYQWLLQQYAKDGDKILDTHVGSASSLIACRNTKHDYIGFELDPEYYKKAKERLETASAQVNIFDFI